MGLSVQRTGPAPADASATATVFLAAEEPARRKPLFDLLKSMHLNVECFDGLESYLENAADDRPGCALLDFRSATIGLALDDTKMAQLLSRPVILIADDTDVSIVVRIMRRGIADFLPRRTYAESDLWEAVQRAFAQDAERRASSAAAESRRRRLETLTESERIVLSRLLQGRNNREISQEIGVSRVAVEGRRARLMKKLGVTTFSGLVRLAVEGGFPCEPSET